MMNNAIAIPTHAFCTEGGHHVPTDDLTWVQDSDDETGWVGAEYQVCRGCCPEAF